MRHRYRAKRFKVDDPELAEAVLAVCRQEFESFAGRPWNERHAAWGKGTTTEKKARRIFAALRRSMIAASEFTASAFAEGRVPTGLAVSLLKQVVDKMVNPALRHSMLAESPNWNRSAPLLSGRAALIRIWDTRDILGLPRRKDGNPRMLSYRELAIISLLSGNFPRSLATYEQKSPGKRVTVADVIDAERQIISKLVEKHGTKWTEFVPVDRPEGRALHARRADIQRGRDR